MATFSELRARARASLGGNIFATTWLLTICAYLLVGVANGIVAVIPFIGGLLSLAVYGPIMVGYQGYQLKVARGEKTDLLSLIDGFKNDLAQNILVGFMMQLFISLWSLLFIIPGIVKSYAYSMAFYIRNDHPEYSWKECLDESQRIMKGNKWKLFLFQWSFIGWMLVAALVPFGIGQAFLAPYTAVANAHFYEEIKNN